jgi:type I restriction enzyme, S subunit
MDAAVKLDGEGKADGPWALPEGWTWEPLGKLGTWMGGGTPSKANSAFWTNGSVPWVSPKDMKVEVIGESEDKITAAAVEESSAKYVPQGSVIMVMRSGILRHSFPVAITDRIVTLNQDLRALTPHSSISPRFIARYLALAANRVLNECSKDGTTVNSIEVPALERLPVPLAPLAEQHRIVARVDALFAEIAEGEVALAAARNGIDTFRRALLKAAVTGELTKDWRAANQVCEGGHDFLARITNSTKAPGKGRGRRNPDAPPLDTRALPPLPRVWAWATLGDLILEIQAGLNVSAKGRPPQEGETGIIKVSAVTWGEFDENASKTLSPVTKINERDIIQSGDFLFSRANTLELVGAPVIVKAITKRLVLSDKILRFRLAGSLDAWIEILLKSAYGRQQIEALATGAQLSMRNISQENIRKIAVPIPPAAEVTEILRRVSDALAATADMEHLLDTEAADSARLKQSILKAAFEGRLVPQDSADESASALLARLAVNPPVIHARRGKPRKSNV